MPNRKPPVITNDDVGDQDEPEQIGILDHTHTPWQRWSEAKKEQAVALLAIGMSMRGAAKALGVSYSSFRAFRISDEPEARAARTEELSATIAEAWEMSRRMLAKIGDAPVRSAQEAAVAYGILSEKAILLEGHRAALLGNPEKMTAMDMPALLAQMLAERDAGQEKEQKRLTASVVQPTE